MFYLQQQAALMAAATAQGTYINPMAALVGAGQLPHALNGMPNPVVPPTSGMFLFWFFLSFDRSNVDILNTPALNSLCVSLEYLIRNKELSFKVREERETCDFRKIISKKWDTRGKNFNLSSTNIHARMYTLLRNFPVSPTWNSFFISPLLSRSPLVYSSTDLAAARVYSPLPYNRLINQYNIFTERDSSERYCQYRETLSKARREREGGKAKVAPFLPFFLTLFPSSSPLSLSSLFRFLSFVQRVHKRRERNSRGR